jgi:hypothetical protein
MPPWLAVPTECNCLVLSAGAAAVTIALTVDWLRIGRTRRAIADTHGVNWVTVTLVAVGLAAAMHFVARVATAGIAPLLADTVAATVFIVTWANVLWWMPELVGRVPEVDDRVERAPLE